MAKVKREKPIGKKPVIENTTVLIQRKKGGKSIASKSLVVYGIPFPTVFRTIKTALTNRAKKP